MRRRWRWVLPLLALLGLASFTLAALLVAGDSEWGDDHCRYRLIDGPGQPEAEVLRLTVTADGWSWGSLGVRCHVVSPDGTRHVIEPIW